MRLHIWAYVWDICPEHLLYLPLKKQSIITFLLLLNLKTSPPNQLLISLPAERDNDVCKQGGLKEIHFGSCKFSFSWHSE